MKKICENPIDINVFCRDKCIYKTYVYIDIHYLYIILKNHHTQKKTYIQQAYSHREKNTTKPAQIWGDKKKLGNPDKTKAKIQKMAVKMGVLDLRVFSNMHQKWDWDIYLHFTPPKFNSSALKNGG